MAKTKKNCPGCGEEIEIVTKESNQIEIPVENNSQQLQVIQKQIEELKTIKEEVKEEKEPPKTQSPSDDAFYDCANGNCDIGLHKNPNYTKRPNQQCKNCNRLNKKKACKNCGNTDPEEFEEKNDEELEEMNIPLPNEVEHEHTQ